MIEDDVLKTLVLLAFIQGIKVFKLLTISFLLFNRVAILEISRSINTSLKVNR